MKPRTVEELKFAIVASSDDTATARACVDLLVTFLKRSPPSVRESLTEMICVSIRDRALGNGEGTTFDT